MTQTQTAQSNSYADIKARLSVPVDRKYVSQHEVGRPPQTRTVDYINVNTYKDLLDERAGIWEAQVTDCRQISDSLCVTLRLFIHASDGIFAMDGTGMEPLGGGGFGDPYSNAYAMAFRRACESHGLSRELWRKEDREMTPQRANSPANTNNPQAPRQYAPTDKPTNGKATSPADLATAKQLGMLRAIVREKNLTMDEVVERAFPGVEEGHLSKRAVSWIIEQFQKVGA